MGYVGYVETTNWSKQRTEHVEFSQGIGMDVTVFDVDLIEQRQGDGSGPESRVVVFGLNPGHYSGFQCQSTADGQPTGPAGEHRFYGPDIIGSSQRSAKLRDQALSKHLADASRRAEGGKW